ncbi:hypothetical protein O181_111731 [Austropuccinia psidii MF-1]|uniref:Uncharacterized protein n=1 Tax=Austropuccinia psidii MF-1 TaxID=1389203 RepID=A0A9Q3PSX7_9BASI|nr:hypothetical protein [Austropuccinia psidii MF-1]
MEAKESIQSDMQNNPEVHQGSEAINLFMTLSRSSIWVSKTVLGPNSKSRTSYLALDRSLFPCPGTTLNESRPYWPIWPPGTPGTPEELGLGGLGDAYYGLWTLKTLNGPKWPKKPNIQEFK